MLDPILEVESLNVSFATPDGTVNAVNDVSFKLRRKRCLGVVGESGSGKSQTFLAVMASLASNASCSGKVLLDGKNLLRLPKAEIRQIRGNRIAFIMQDALTALTPHMRIGELLMEGLMIHKKLSRSEATRKILNVLDVVRIPDAASRINMYPHELSGGMRQRILIAQALLCEPDIIIADEPTTALDVTVQAQILDIFDELKRDTDVALVLITHDLGVIAGRADEVMVMYGGRAVEKSEMRALYVNPLHPYTAGLLAAMPSFASNLGEALPAIAGQPPDLQSLPKGCAFMPRCSKAAQICTDERPLLKSYGDRKAACHFAEGS